MAGYDLHKKYAMCMKGRSEGHALYRAIPATRLKPGTCGYFDNDGDWQVIVQTSKPKALQEHKLPALSDVRFFKDEGKESWGPITSDGVEGRRVNLDVHAADGTHHVVAGGKLEFTSSQTLSGILIAQGDVEHHQSTPETEIRAWGSANAQALVDLSRDRDIIKKKGFWIVTKTYTAESCSIALLAGRESTASYSVDVKAHGVNVTPTMEWWSNHNDQEWRDLRHPDGRVVMFMCGIWWRPRFLTKKMKAVSDKKKQKHLAGHTGPVPVDVLIRSETSAEAEDFQFTPAAVGRIGQGNLQLPSAKSSPFDDQDLVEESDEDDDTSSEASDLDDDE